MKNLQLRLPDSVHTRIKELARQEGISLNQFLVTAASNEVVRQETRDFFHNAARGFNATEFAAALAAVPDVKPAAPDVIKNMRTRT